MIRAGLIAIALFGAAPSFAQQQAATPDTATLAAAREMMAVTDMKGTMRAMGPRMAETMGQQMRQRFVDSKVPEGLQNQITAALQAFVGSMDTMFTPETIDKVAMVYARHFTVNEIQSLTAMMKDPVMVKFRAQMPQVMSEMMPVIFEAIKPQQQLFEARLKQIVTDWIAQHPEDKAKLRSPIAS